MASVDPDASTEETAFRHQVDKQEVRLGELGRKRQAHNRNNLKGMAKAWLFGSESGLSPNANSIAPPIAESMEYSPKLRAAIIGRFLGQSGSM